MCEADDHFAIIQHLLTPSHEIKAIIASHNEWVVRTMPTRIAEMTSNLEGDEKAIMQENIKKGMSMLPARGGSMAISYEEGNKLLHLAEIDDVPMLKGSAYEIQDLENLPDSEGADFIIREAMREDTQPLFVCLQGCLTDLAIALIKEPAIAERLTAVWIGGGDYPKGGDEFNIKQDLEAARIVFESPVKLWQIPCGTYKTMEFSFAELVHKVKPCGRIGAYLCEQMLAFNQRMADLDPMGDFPHGEMWSIGDNPTISVLLQNAAMECWHTENAPIINEDCTYTSNPNGKLVRVYDSVDTRLTLDDLFSKLALCYR